VDNYIFKKDAALTKEESNNCIKYFYLNKNTQKDTTRGYFYFHPAPSLEWPEFKFLENILVSNINEYVQQHLFLNQLYARWTIDKLFNIQKYNPGDSYGSEHMEHGKEDFDCKRLLAWMIYLNDVKDKGGTCWPQQNFTSIPRTGDLYIWPAGWTHSHYGVASPTEIKYIITGWCSFE
jgi:hypothetical protein